MAKQLMSKTTRKTTRKTNKKSRKGGAFFRTMATGLSTVATNAVKDSNGFTNLLKSAVSLTGFDDEKATQMIDSIMGLKNMTELQVEIEKLKNISGNKITDITTIIRLSKEAIVNMISGLMPNSATTTFEKIFEDFEIKKTKINEEYTQLLENLSENNLSENNLSNELRNALQKTFKILIDALNFVKKTILVNIKTIGPILNPGLVIPEKESIEGMIDVPLKPIPIATPVQPITIPQGQVATPVQPITKPQGQVATPVIAQTTEPITSTENMKTVIDKQTKQIEELEKQIEDLKKPLDTTPHGTKLGGKKSLKNKKKIKRNNKKSLKKKR